MSITKGLEWTFNTEAEKYEKMRPGYVSELYEDIFKYIPINESSNVIEIGIGGGQATLPILKTGCKLTAVECGENLAELCRQKFKEFPKFSAVIAKFEDFVCDNNLCDLIYSATAFHWIPEEIHEALQKIYSVYMPDSHSPNEYSEDDAKKRADIAQKYGFVDISYKLYHRTRSFSAKEYISLLGTYSDHIAIEQNTRKKLFSEIEKAIDNLGGQITIYDTIDLQLARKP